MARTDLIETYVDLARRGQPAESSGNFLVGALVAVGAGFATWELLKRFEALETEAAPEGESKSEPSTFVPVETQPPIVDRRREIPDRVI